MNSIRSRVQRAMAAIVAVTLLYGLGSAVGEVDQMAFIGLAIHFPWIWYPSSDDIAIFDDSLAWLLFVDHEGQLAVVWPTAIDAGMDPTTRHVAQAHRYSDVDH